MEGFDPDHDIVIRCGRHKGGYDNHWVDPNKLLVPGESPVIDTQLISV